MADEETPSGPSLEPPSLFRRRKKPEPTSPVVDDSPTTILDDVGPVAVAPIAQPPGPKPTAPPLFADEAPTRPVAPPAAPLAAPTPVRRAPRQGPMVPGRVAAAIAGLVAGAVIVGLTTASFSLCEAIQGTDSCGGPGIFLLLAILVLAVVVGTAILKLCQVGEGGSTSFLAVGLTSVIALLFLIDQLFEWWMLIAIPLVSVATFLLSPWVTSTFVEPEPQVGLTSDPEVVDHDVR